MATPYFTQHRSRLRQPAVWISAFILFLLLCWWGLTAMKKQQQEQAQAYGVPLKPSIAEVSFDDLTTLKVLQLGTGKIIDSHYSPADLKSKSNATSGHGGMFFRIRNYKKDDKLIGIQFSSTPGALLIECQLTNIADTPIKRHSSLQDSGKITNINHNLNTDYIFTTAAEFLATPPSTIGHPPVILQLLDDTGHWTTARGPSLPIQRSRDGVQDKLLRHVYAFVAWDASQKELKFRALCIGSKPKFFQLKNPFYKPTGTPLKTTPFPQVYKSADFTFSVKNAHQYLIPEQGRLIQFSELLTSKHPSSSGLSPFSYSLIRCEQPNGTPCPSISRTLQRKKHTLYGNAIPSHVSQVKLTYSIDKTESYPYNKSSSIILAEGTVSADLKSIKINKTYTPHGINQFEVGKIRKNYNGKLCVDINLKGLWKNSAQEAAAKRALGDYVSHAHLVGFIDNRKTSSAYAEQHGSGSGSGSGRTNFNVSYYFFQDFKPGQKITFALVPRAPARIIHFNVDLPRSRKIIEKKSPQHKK